MKRLGRHTALATVAGLLGCGGLDELVDHLPSSNSQPLGGVVQVPAASCKTPYAVSSYGHVVYSSETYGHVYRVEAHAGSDPEDISYELDKLSAGQDTYINSSQDGQWLVVSTTRFGCGSAQPCLALISQDVCSGQVVIDGNGTPFTADEWPAIGNLAGGDLIIVAPQITGARVDLYALRRTAGAWSTPLLLTSDSAYPYNAYPALSSDSTKLLFDCGTNSYSGGEGTSICQVNIDGTGFQVLKAPTDGPPGDGAWPLHKANFSPSGAIVFEGEWPTGDELVWEYKEGNDVPDVVNGMQNYPGHDYYSDDNTPCVMPDGRIVSLWLGRPGGNADHEIKVMDADGSNGAMLVVNQNTLDVGIGCSK